MRFTHQEPSGNERENLMVMPAAPVANFIMRQPRFALAAFNGFFNSMGGQRNASKLLDGSIARSVREIEVVLGHTFVVQTANDHQCFFVFQWPLQEQSVFGE